MTIALVVGSNVSANVAGAPGIATTGAVDTTGATLLIASIGWFNPATQSTTAPAVSDSKSNTWTPLTVRNSGNNVGNVLYYAKNPIVGSGHTFTLTSVNGFSSICVAGFSGTDTTSPFDVQNGAGGTSGATRQTGSITPSVDNELVIAGIGAGASGDPFSINVSFTIAQQDSGGASAFPSALAYIVQTSAAAVNPTWTLNASDQSGVSIASFKAAAAGGFFSRDYYDMIGR